MTPARFRTALFCCSAALPALALWPGNAGAGPSKSFRVTTYKEFAEGQEQGVLLSSQGDALSGFTATRLALPSLSDDSVRAMVAAPDGTVYLGTGGEAPSILAYVQGKPALRTLARLATTTWVSALCLLPNGEILAGTAQDGRVFAVGKDGKSRVYAKVEGDHVWALLHDAKRGVTYVATGPGKLFAVDKAGKAQKVFDSGARQILGLAQGEDGSLYVGSADDAVLYRVEWNGSTAKVRALHDFSGNEVRAVARSGAAIYVAVNDMQKSGGDSAGGPSRGIKITPLPAGSTPGNNGPRPGGSTDRQGKGALYRVDADGRIEQLHAISDGFFNALYADPEGNLFAAASMPGGRGKVYWVRPDRTVLTALELKESDVLSLSFGPLATATATAGAKGKEGAKERLVGTGNSGAVYRVEWEAPKDANYLSKVFDGLYPSRWGSLRYSGTGPLKVETRSGNLVKPDSTWGPWQGLEKLLPTPAPGEIGGKVASPMGRYLQVRVHFGGKAVLHDFTVSYQPMNQRPRITEIQVGDDPLGRVARVARGTGAGGTAAKPRLPLVKLRWKVENPDEDELVYRLYVRPLRQEREGQTGGEGWLRLGGADPLTKPEYEWNTESVPDGVYEAKVVVSDERGNAAEQVLTHEMLAPPFVVDNRRPELWVSYDLKTQRITGKAQDAVSPLSELSYAVDGGDFLPVAARDGVIDDLVEEFAFPLVRLGAGLHTVVVRAIDGADNVAAVQLVVRTKD